LAALGALNGRAALVVGGGGHIGRVCCETLAEAGARIGIIDNDVESAENAARALREIGAEAFAAGLDLADEDVTRAGLKAALDRLDGIDVLVHTAAYVNQGNVAGYAAPFAEQ
jgi:NAD(P)-dependent dehydrogenase (short-subunit alcohol dehydrogenase family)